MFSKFLRTTVITNWKLRPWGRQNVKQFSDILPPDQYETAPSKKFQMGYVLKEYWETIPLFVTTCTAMTIMVLAIAWACRNKVDTVFTTHSRDNISRTMDLRNPTVHKIVTINQRYEPWPEMQDLLDKMRSAEKRALVRAQICSHP